VPSKLIRVVPQLAPHFRQPSGVLLLLLGVLGVGLNPVAIGVVPPQPQPLDAFVAAALNQDTRRWHG
jgi:hypothetical protein